MENFITLKISTFFKKLSLVSFFLLGVSLHAQSEWKNYFEDEQIKIEYQLSDCSDERNDFQFHYYVLKIENKKKDAINVQFDFSSRSTEEEHFSITMKSRAVLVGSCTSKEAFLKKFVDVKKLPLESFNLFNLRVYEL